MGYGRYEIDGKPCGYLVRAWCEHPFCFRRIDRGLAYACGGEPGAGEWWCDGYFCPRHLRLIVRPGLGEPLMLCERCADEFDRLVLVDEGGS